MKYANALVHLAVCSAVLSFAGQASGETAASPTVRSPWDEVPRSERMAWSDYPEAVRTAWDAVVTGVQERGRDAFPDLARFTDETELDSGYLGVAFWMIDKWDGLDAFTPGDPHLLASARNILPRLLDHNKRHETEALSKGLLYLAKKGDARDFPLFEKYLADPVFQRCQSEFSGDGQGEQFDLFFYLAFPYRILQHRAAGTNIVRGTFDAKQYPYFNRFAPADGNSYSTNRLHFIPSVVNTGPQAAYVYEALEQAHALGRRIGCDSPFSSVTNIAPELLTMRVWFDADGKAVCDVDLAKHGISVPGLSMAANAPPPLEPPAIAPPARSCPVGLVAIVAGVLVTLFLLAGFHRKLSKW